MRGAAGTRDDHFQPALARSRRIFEQKVRGAVGGDDTHFVRNRELLERLGRGGAESRELFRNLRALLDRVTIDSQ